jgi:hypothetical protein
MHALPHRIDARGGTDRPHPRRAKVLDPVARCRRCTTPEGGAQRAEDIALLEDLCETMKFGSLCALGGFTPYPVLSALRTGRKTFRGFHDPGRGSCRWSVHKLWQRQGAGCSTGKR